MFYIDSFKHPYVQLEKEIILPSVSLVNFEPLEAKKIYQLLIDYFPSFTEDFKIIHQDQIIGQKKYYSFLKVKNFDKIHIGLELRILSSYAGGASKEELLENPIQNYSPSFRTNKIYFFLFMYAIDNYIYENQTFKSIESYYIDFIRNYRIPYTDIKVEPWTVNLFDDLEFEELIKEIEKKIPYEWNAKVWKKPFTIERATLALNLIHIDQFEYLVEDFIKFIYNINNQTFESDTFKVYFLDWEIERCLSKSGNLHWKFTKVPFINLSF